MKTTPNLLYIKKAHTIQGSLCKIVVWLVVIPAVYICCVVPVLTLTLCFFYKNSFYKNHEPEIVEKLRIT